MTQQQYDLVLTNRLDSSSTSEHISKLDDSQVIKLYKNKIERKRDQAYSPRTKHQVSRDYQVVFVKDKAVGAFGKGRRLFAVLEKMRNRRWKQGFQKVKEFCRDVLWGIQEDTICVDDVKLPIDQKKAEQGLENIHDVWQRRVQLLIVSGFMRISYEQKQVIRKREQVESALRSMRIEQVFSILKDFTVRKRSKGIQADLLNPTDSVIQKVDSSTILDSFYSKNKGRTFRNPFSKTKHDNDGTSVNCDDSKISEPTSLHTINLKMNKLERVLQEARKIRESNQLTKRNSSGLPDFQGQGEENSMFRANIANHSCSQIRGNFNDSWGDNRRNKNSVIDDQQEEERRGNYSKMSGHSSSHKYPIFKTMPSEEINYQKTKRYSSAAPETENTRKESRTRTKIHQIIQPVIQQVVQPIHYHHYSYQSSFAHSHNYYPSAPSTPRSSQSWKQPPPPMTQPREYLPRTDRIERTPFFSRVYAATPKYKSKIWS